MSDSLPGAPTDRSEPLIDPQTLQVRRALFDDKDGFPVYKRLKNDNQWRTDKAAAISRKYNDEQPWDPQKLKASGQGWRRNASTGFYSSLIKQTLPAYNQLIDSSRVLTYSSLKSSLGQDEEQLQDKSDKFQVETTKTIRKWVGFNAFKSQLVLENSQFGFSGACWTDEILWKPIHLRQDECFFPEGSPQEPERIPLWAKEQNFLIHEMADYLVNPVAAELSGWDVEAVVESINEALPEQRMKTSQDLRKYEDIIRESSYGTSYMDGAKVIEAVHLFVQEAWGQVSHYIYRKKDGKVLFKRLDRFDNMNQCLRLTTIEVGNGKLYGSKGAGRVLYNTSVSAEQARNQISDNLYLAGLLLLKAGDDAKPQQALSVAHPLAIIGRGYDISQVKFDVNYEAFKALDDHFTRIAEMQISAFMPQQIEPTTSGDQPTASQVNLVASQQQQIREGVLSRFWSQFLDIVSEMQRRIYSPDNIAKALKIFQAEQAGAPIVSKKMVEFAATIGQPIQGPYIVEDELDELNDAVNACLNLLRKTLTPQEIFTLANSPANQLIDDNQQTNQAMIQAVVSAYAGNPNINQVILRELDISSKLGYQTYEKLEIPEEDQTLQQEATRMQLLELTSLLGGEQVPISPRDLDQFHMQVIQQKAGQLLAQPGLPTPQTLPLLQGVLTHFEAHLQSAIAKQGGKPQGLEQFVQFDQQAKQMLKQAQGMMQKALNPLSLSPGHVPALPPPGSGGHYEEADIHALHEAQQPNLNTNLPPGTQMQANATGLPGTGIPTDGPGSQPLQKKPVHLL